MASAPSEEDLPEEFIENSDRLTDCRETIALEAHQSPSELFHGMQILVISTLGIRKYVMLLGCSNSDKQQPETCHAIQGVVLHQTPFIRVITRVIACW